MDEQVEQPPSLEVVPEEKLIDFRSLAEDVPVMLWQTNSDGENIFSNNRYKSFIGRESVEKLGGKAWFNALHPDDQKTCLAIFSEAFQTHKAFVMEYRLKRHDGEYRYILDRGEPYINRGGKFGGFIGSSSDITVRRLSEDELKKSHQELIQYNNEMSLINELNAYLQVCRGLSETYPVIYHYAEQIFPDWVGSLYLFNDNKTLAESITSWGSRPVRSIDVIAPDDCWALRQGKEHIAIDTTNRLLCNHAHEDIDSYTCTPIIAQGEMLGILHLEYAGDRQFESEDAQQRYFESRQRLMKITADNLGLSLVSLKLREALKHQSIRDPLTSLFNRRYMEESLERETSRCERAGEGLGVIMVDIDHFKKFNDDFGHDAGDVVLVEFAEFMTAYFRQSDIICRFGGEEFIVIMPGAPKNLVVERATQLCHKLHDVEVYYESKKLPSVTASFGVSYLPGDDYKQAGIIVKLADTALYAAKRAGRDQVIVYDSLSHVVGEEAVQGSGYVKDLQDTI
jgi:diguanylate cyclase (GGDEF)-like protein/PAS domain S-box-containing protein